MWGGSNAAGDVRHDGRKLFNRHYGTFFDVALFPYLNRTEPRPFVPGMPATLYAGARLSDLRFAAPARASSSCSNRERHGTNVAAGRSNKD
jgi:hypothetical protein